jgi:hypothetical protein
VLEKWPEKVVGRKHKINLLYYWIVRKVRAPLMAPTLGNVV